MVVRTTGPSRRRPSAMPATYVSKSDPTSASICSRWGSVNDRSVNWFGAFLYFPTPSNWASTPSLSSVPR